jgi:cell division transport system permease protein
VIGFLIGEAARDLVRAGRVAVAAVALIALSLGIVGAFWLLSVNLGAAAAQWHEGMRIIVYLKDDPGAPGPGQLVERLHRLDGVAEARYVSKAEALNRLKHGLGARVAVADSLPENPLPASIELTPSTGASTPEAMRALVARVAAMPEVEDVHGSTASVQRASHWQGLLQLIGVGIGALLGLGAIVTITTATTLALHARREEIEIMRLVGASEAVIRVPLMAQGIAQGLLGALLAVGALLFVHRALLPLLEPLAVLALGLSHVTFLSGAAVTALVAAGAVLGGVGGLLAKGRA